MDESYERLVSLAHGVLCGVLCGLVIGSELGLETGNGLGVGTSEDEGSVLDNVVGVEARCSDSTSGTNAGLCGVPSEECSKVEGVSTDSDSSDSVPGSEDNNSISEPGTGRLSRGSVARVGVAIGDGVGI